MSSQPRVVNPDTNDHQGVKEGRDCRASQCSVACIMAGSMPLPLFYANEYTSYSIKPYKHNVCH